MDTQRIKQLITELDHHIATITQSERLAYECMAELAKLDPSLVQSAAGDLINESIQPSLVKQH